MNTTTAHCPGCNDNATDWTADANAHTPWNDASTPCCNQPACYCPNAAWGCDEISVRTLEAHAEH